MDVKSTFIALLCGVAALAAQAGQVYKWVDPSGRVHFSDTPRQGWTPVDMNGATAATAEAAEGAGGSDVADDGSRDQLRAEECKRAKEQLESYKKAPKILERDALGKEKEYSNEERLQLIEQTQKRVRDYCGTQSP